MVVALTIPYLSELSYLAIPLVMLLGSFGLLPIMEELILLVVGYLTFLHVLHFWPAVLVSIASVVLVENLHFYLGSHGHHMIKRHMNTKLLARLQRAVDAHGWTVVFIARFVPGMRILTPWVASTSGMRQRAFFFPNLLGAIIQTPLVIWIGSKLSHQIEKGIAVVHAVDDIVAIALIILIVLVAILACVFRHEVRCYFRSFRGSHGRV